MKHSFGGPWTQIKLEMLRRYLTAFNTALQRRPTPTNRFRRIYIDAFAGTGECEIKADDMTVETIAGSAKLAVETQPSFDEIHLIDLNKDHIADLQQLAAASNGCVRVYQEDANVALLAIIKAIDWKRSRGVLFLDPYGMGVPWSTLEITASTHALDVWYLFPLSAIYRQAAKKFEKIDEGKLAALDAVLGTSTWRAVFYQSDCQISLIGDGERLVRSVDAGEIAAFVRQRLMGVFKGWVSEPLFLRNSRGAPLFSLFCCIANPSEKAVNLSRRMAAHILERFDIPVKRGKPSTDIGTAQDDLFDPA